MRSYALIMPVLLVLAAGHCWAQGEESDTSSPEESSPSPAADVACKLGQSRPCQVCPAQLRLTVCGARCSYDREFQLALLPRDFG